MRHRATRHALAAATALAVLSSACTASGPLDVAGVRPPESGPPVVEIIVLAGDDLSPLDAEVTIDEVLIAPDGSPTGRSFVWPGRPVTIGVAAAGFETTAVEVSELPDSDVVEVRLDPVTLFGRVTNDIGLPVPGVRVELGAGRDVTNDDGRFEIARAEPGELVLERPAWEAQTITWVGIPSDIDITMEPLSIFGVRVSGRAPGDARQWDALLAMARNTGVNAFVLDVKDEFGTVFYETSVEEAHTIGAVSALYDLDQVIADMDEAGLYKIARIAAFQDTPMASANPDHAVIHSETGELWLTGADQAWMDPSDPVSYEYPIALAEEVCRAGFDEAQFDFASFPLGGDKDTAVFDTENIQENRVASIIQFLERAYSVLNPLGCAVGSTLLGITLESPTDEGTGQTPGRMSRTIDVLSPTLYTTSYGPGWKELEDPDQHAFRIVDEALASGLSRMEGFGYLRPWLQTWTISADDVQTVQRAAHDRGLGWMLWSNSASYDAGILLSL